MHKAHLVIKKYKISIVAWLMLLNRKNNKYQSINISIAFHQQKKTNKYLKIVHKYFNPNHISSNLTQNQQKQ